MLNVRAALILCLLISSTASAQLANQLKDRNVHAARMVSVEFTECAAYADVARKVTSLPPQLKEQFLQIGIYYVDRAIQWSNSFEAVKFNSQYSLDKILAAVQDNGLDFRPMVDKYHDSCTRLIENPEARYQYWVTRLKEAKRF